MTGTALQLDSHPMPTQPTAKVIGGTLLAGGVLTFVGGNLHPRADTDAEYEEAVAGMLEDAAWTASHALAAIGVALIGVAFAMFVRTARARADRSLGVALKLAVVAAIVQFVELVPHTFADRDRTELLAGGSTPLLDVHSLIQAVATPMLGLSLALVAVTEARTSPTWTRLVAAIAVIGGIAYALAGPLMLIAENPALSPLFAGASGMSIWAIVTGARIVWARQVSPVVA